MSALANFTGKTPILEATGQTFAQVLSVPTAERDDQPIRWFRYCRHEDRLLAEAQG